MSAVKDLYTASDKTLHFVQSDMGVVLSDMGIILSDMGIILSDISVILSVAKDL